MMESLSEVMEVVPRLRTVIKWSGALRVLEASSPLVTAREQQGMLSKCFSDRGRSCHLRYQVENRRGALSKLGPTDRRMSNPQPTVPILFG